MKVKTIGPVDQFNSKHGPMKSYSLQFEGSDDWVKMNQKPETPAPTVGQELEGIIEDGPYGKKFTKAQNTSGGFQKGVSSDPATRTSIERQTSLNAAVEAVRDFYTSHAMAATGDKIQIGGDLKGYINQIISSATAFERHLETGQAVQATVQDKVQDKVQTSADAFDQALAELGGDEVDNLPNELPEAFWN